MPKANRVCQYCGKEYYVCYSCVKINSYKRAFCSPECYRASLQQEITRQDEIQENTTVESGTKKKSKKKETKHNFFSSVTEDTII